MRRLPLSRCYLLAIIVLSVLALASSTFAAPPDRIASIAGGASIRLGTGVPMQAKPEFDKGAVDPSFKIQGITLLTVPSPAQQKAIDELLADQQNPNSPLYHQWLTPEQYADRFGLSPNDVAKITAWLQSKGFTVLRTARGRNWIVFSGTAAQVQSVFRTEIHHFAVNGHTYFSNTTAPAIPAALSGVVTGFRGMSNFPAKSNAKRLTPGYTEKSGEYSYFFLAPGDIAAIYDINNLIGAGTNGTGQKLAVIGETDVYLDDLANFRSGFDISAITGCTTNGTGVITSCTGGNFKYVFGDTGSDPGTPNSLGDDLAEADIDLEWSNAVARDATIVYVNAPNNGVFTAAYYAIDNNEAPVMTMSYTTPCELAEAEGGSLTADEAEFKKANSEGITFFNSAGDTGAAECDYGSDLATGGYAVAYPASSPEVTGVGGTSIPAVNPGEYTTTYWNSSNDGSGDGGSAKGYIPEQPWNDAQEFGYECTPPKTCTLSGVSSWSTAQTAIGISAGGGGVSNCITANSSNVCTGGFAQPSWQSALNTSVINPGNVGAINSPSRYTPDVSLLASTYFPGYIVCTADSELNGTANTSICTGGASGISNMLSACLARTGPCSVFGGTSVASPVMAGIATLLNQYVVAKGLQANPGLGNMNPNLYKLAASNATNGAFNTVNTASSGSYSDGAFCIGGAPGAQPASLQCPTSGANADFLGFDSYNSDATTGYNLVTGLGSVDAGNLFTAWVAETAATFSLSANPTSVSIAQGANGTSTITVTSTNSFNSAVTLTASGLPTGVTAAFSSNPVTPPANSTVTSTLTLTVGSAVTPGTYTVTITGTSGSSTATTTVSLTVTAGPSFTLSANPTSVSVAQGSAGTSTITVTDVAGFTGNVTLAASGLPSGVTAGFSPNPTANTSTLTLTVSSSASIGTSTVTITGTSGALTATTTVSLTVTAGPGFTLAASPASMTITPTLTGSTSTITVTDVGGFTGNVTLTASGLPTGVTAGFSPNPTGATSTLTLTAGASASAGTATVTITGKSGALTATTTIALTVTPPPNFTLSASPSSLSLTAVANPSTTTTVTVTPTNGFTGTVNFSVSGLPNGVLGTFSPTSSTTSSVLTLVANTSAASGTYSVTVKGTSGSLTNTASVSLTVVQNISATFTTTPPAVDPGQYTSATLQVTTDDGKPFASSVTFACPSAALPAGVTCTLPATIAAGTASGVNVTVQMNTVGPFSGAAGDARHREQKLKLRGQNQRLWVPLSLPLAGIMLVGLAGKRMPRLYQILGMCLIVAFAGFLAACGSSSHPAVVTVSPSSVSTLYPNLVINGASGTPQTQQFTASVSNATDQTVTWAVTGGSANGTIDANGLYTAPATLPSSSAVTVTATSTATTTPGSATVNLQTPTAATNGSEAVQVTLTEGGVTYTAAFPLTVN